MANLLTSEVVRRLALGELTNLKMAEAKDGTILTADLPTVLLEINNALKTIYSKFLLKKQEIIVQLQEEITDYYIRWEFAASNGDSTQPILYLDDSLCDGFDGRIVKILNVYDSLGRELYMNKAQEPYSIFTPSYDQLQITANQPTEELHVIFQALHPIVVHDPDADPVTDSPIYIPPALEAPLVLLAASKIFGNMNGEANLTKSAILHQQYEGALVESEFRDTASTSENMSNSKLERAGFI